MSARSAAYACMLCAAACTAGHRLQVGEPRVILIHLWNPYNLSRDLETFLGGYRAKPVIDLKQRLKDPDVAGAWDSLEPWERQLWRDYAARGHGRTDTKRTNFHVTDGDLLLMALDLSFEYMPRGAREEGHRLIGDPAFVGGLVSGVGLYILLWIYPEPVFTKGIASIITAALLLQFSVQEIQEFAWAWRAMDQELTHAQSITQVEAAAAKFGRSVGVRGLHILMLIAGKLAGKALEGLPGATGSTRPSMAATTAGLVLAEGQELWILNSGVVSIVGPEALAVTMSAAVGPDAEQNAGGHLVERHVGKTQSDLAARLAANSRLKRVSTFLSRTEADSAVSALLRARTKELASWLAGGAHENLILEGPFNGGLVLQRGATACVPGTSVRLVLRGDGAGGWYILTGYPLP